MNNKLMSKLNFFTAIVFLAIFAAVDTFGQTKQAGRAETATFAPGPNSYETEAIERIVRNYILKNPAVIREAQQVLQAQEQRDREEQVARTMRDLRNEILSNPDSPSVGNAEGDVSVVVFFDYNCGYCKKTIPQLNAITEKDPMVRVVFKDFPILGPQSFAAARAALAAGRQGKYIEFHNALFAAENTSENVVRSISRKLGLDYAKLQKDIADPKIEERLARNIRLAAALDINGTPAYIVGDRIIPGAIDLMSLIKIVQDRRSAMINAKPIPL